LRYFIFIFLFYCISCRHKNALIDASIIEKSSINPPFWLQTPPGSLEAESDVFELVFQKSSVLELGLGLKQARESGVLEFKQSLADLAIRDLKSKAKCKEPEVVGDIIEKTVHRLASDSVNDANIADMYFEQRTLSQVSGHSGTFYNVFVFLSAKKESYLALRDGAAEVLSKNSRLSSCF
jgi:hypothetical protein